MAWAIAAAVVSALGLAVLARKWSRGRADEPVAAGAAGGDALSQQLDDELRDLD